MSSPAALSLRLRAALGGSFARSLSLRLQNLVQARLSASKPLPSSGRAASHALTSPPANPAGSSKLMSVDASAGLEVMAIIPGDARAHDIAGQFATEELASRDMRWAGAMRLEKSTHAPGGLKALEVAPRGRDRRSSNWTTASATASLVRPPFARQHWQCDDNCRLISCLCLFTSSEAIDETAPIYRLDREHGGCLAPCRTRATGVDTGDRISPPRSAGAV